VDDAFLPLAMEQKALFSRCIATLSDLPLLSVRRRVWLYAYLLTITLQCTGPL